jgi:putative phosphoesterase
MQPVIGDSGFMKTILILSDTHGVKIKMMAAVHRYPDADMIFHLGDLSRDADYIRTHTDKPVYGVRGNCDLNSSAEADLILSVEGVRILLVHGHKQSVKTSLLGLGLYAQEKEADIALFGHTHIPTEQFYHNIRLYNPGSLGEPRGKPSTVGLMTVDQGAVTIKTVKI